jgi:hypothetical protein
MKTTLLTLSALALAACDTLAVRTTGEPTPLFRVEDPEYAGKDRDFRVVLLDDGATLGGRDALQAATIAGLQANARFVTRFTTAPKTHNPDFKVVLIFNPARNVKATDLCREPPVAPRFAPADDDIHVQGVFCRLNDALTESEGYASGIKSAGDARFQALMSAFTRQLFPSRDLRLGDMPE